MRAFPKMCPRLFPGRGLSCVLRGERPCLSSRARRTHTKAALAGLEEPVGLLVRLNAKRAFLVLVLHFPPPQNERSSRASCARAVSRGLCWRKALRGCAWARDAPGISAARARGPGAGVEGKGKMESGKGGGSLKAASKCSKEAAAETYVLGFAGTGNDESNSLSLTPRRTTCSPP